MITTEAIDRIVRFNGDGLPVVSLYSPVGVGAGRRDVRARVSSLLHQIKPLATDGSLGHEARMSLRTDIERIEKALAEEHWPPGAIGRSKETMYARLPPVELISYRLLPPHWL